MIRILAAALLTVSLAASAHARPRSGVEGANGTSFNGVSINGAGLNVIESNDVNMQGLSRHGAESAGHGPVGSRALVAVELPR